MSLEHFFSSMLGIENKKVVQRLCEISQVTSLRQGQVLARKGEAQRNLLFLLEGVCRGYYITEDGAEVTDCFLSGCGVPMQPSHELGGEAEVNIVAETGGCCVSIEIASLLPLLAESDELMRLRNRLLRERLAEQVGIKHVLYFERARTRYLWFLKHYDGLIDVVRHKDIASFLKMEPESLSRIRKALAEEKKA